MAEQADRPREALTTRLARLGMSMRENENKALIAEAVEALHEADTALVAPETPSPTTHLSTQQRESPMETICTYEQRGRLCVEHSGRYFGGKTCSNRRKGDRLDAKIAKLAARRDAMRTYWKRQP